MVIAVRKEAEDLFLMKSIAPDSNSNAGVQQCVSAPAGILPDSGSSFSVRVVQQLDNWVHQERGSVWTEK
jgi:hypothetical protein